MGNLAPMIHQNSGRLLELDGASLSLIFKLGCDRASWWAGRRALALSRRLSTSSWPRMSTAAGRSSKSSSCARSSTAQKTASAPTDLVLAAMLLIRVSETRTGRSWTPCASSYSGCTGNPPDPLGTFRQRSPNQWHDTRFFYISGLPDPPRILTVTPAAGDQHGPRLVTRPITGQ